MTCRTPAPPFLPGGFQRNANLFKTNFGRRPLFDHAGNVRMLVEKITPYLPGKIHERYPSIYTRDVTELPGWIAFDRQILTFDAYFQETLHESNTPTILRKCKIYFYLEDGTIKINEPKTRNSGVLQGNILARSRVCLPPPKDELFYDIIDFNIGKEVEIYGRNYKFVNCDKFTRTFLNRLGISVPDPVPFPDDPYMASREKEVLKYPKKPKTTSDKLAQMYKYDRKVLRFYGYWDDRSSEGGYIHDLTIHYYLMDDTMEIIETMDSTRSLLIKRGKLFKNMPHLPEPGFFEDLTMLNVLNNGRSKLDLLNSGITHMEYYLTTDLAIGAAVNAYGRKIILCDCDEYTKNYYKTYGIDNFTPIERPKTPSPPIAVPLHKRKLPPWNGYGSFEDSAQNCVTVEPKAQLRDVKQFLKLDRCGFDSRILRFKAVNRARPAAGACGRKFIICYYLSDDTISIHEVQGKNAGPTFMVRCKVKLPGQQVFVSEEYDYYEAHHLYVGATLDLNGFIFILIDADEYALRYMELNSKQFPKSNIKLVMNKVRKKIKPIYKDFLVDLHVKESFIEFDYFREKLMKLMGEDWSEHEMLTLARYYSAVCKEKRHSRSYIRSLVLIDLRRNLWQDLERFKECFRHYDANKSGFLPKTRVYNLIRGCKLPLDTILINSMLDVLKKNDKCEIEGLELFDFIDESVGRRHDVEPINQSQELSWSTEPEISAGKLIDWCKLSKDINIETDTSDDKDKMCNQS